MTNKKELNEMVLLKEIEYNNKLYHKGQPEISDAEFDALAKNVSEKLSFENVAELKNPQTHHFPMLSLAKAYTLEDLTKFIKQVKNQTDEDIIEVVLEPKIDGIGLNCCYVDGVFVSALTRGDGVVGENITEMIKQCIPKYLPLQIKDAPGVWEVRGEVFITHKKFEQIRKQESYSNSRNTIAGCARSPKASATHSKQGAQLKHASIVFYEVLSQNWPQGAELTTTEKLAWLKKNNFTANFSHKNTVTNAEELHHTIQGFKNQLKYFVCEIENNSQGASAHLSNIPQDGVVVKLNTANSKKILGCTAKYPKWAVAFKWNEPGVKTTVERISYTIGRTGGITPVAKIAPVIIDGTKINKVTLNNLNYLKKLDVRLKDSVLVIKAGQIIPQILKVLTHERDGSSQPVDIQKSLLQQNMSIAFVNGEWVSTDCEAIQEQKIRHYAKTLKIVGLGPALIKQLVGDGSVTNAFDLYNLTPDQLVKYINIGPKTALQVVSNIQKTRSCAFQKWVVACGIPNIGPQTAKILTHYIPSVEALLNFQNQPPFDAILGNVTTQQLLSWVLANQQLLENFKHFTFTQLDQLQSEGSLYGYHFVITGRFKTLKRKQLETQIEGLGGTIQAKINKKTRYLLVGALAHSPKASGASESKLSRGKLLELQILTEAETLDFLTQKNN
uniref:DNA ligase (NAD(+)) n=1 Tax=Flabellia petiolata TaxID=189428 RepID=A0A386AX69_9CHLO|nr:hypothetical protein [Flabellia petiolata]